MSKYFPFRLLVAAIFIVLIVPLLIQDGMFMDGTIYASVSNNLSNGLGNFWSLTFSETFMTDYSEQLPLFFGIQAAFFNLLGHSIYSERIFLFVMACLTGFNIIKIWKITHANDKEIRQLEWLPVFLWIIIPVCFWAYVNNVQETLMAVFATSAVYFILKGLMLKNNIVLNLILGGTAIFCCSFCKGFQGLFPLVTVGIYWLFFRDISLKKMLWLSFIVLLVPLLIYSALLLNDTSYQCLLNNFNNRIMRTFTNPGSTTTSNHLYLVYRLFSELIPSLLSIILVFTIFHLKRINVKVKNHFNHFWFYFLIGISGSLPLIVTSEQRGFYLVTSLPFFALSLASLVAPYLNQLTELINIKSKGFTFFKVSTTFLLFLVIIFSGFQVSKTKRDNNKLHDVYAIGNNIPKGSIISVTPILRQDYSLVAYFTRHYNISLDMNSSVKNNYFLKRKSNAIDLSKDYFKVDLPLKDYELFKKVGL